ncbi:MAG: prolipoprotein diacylglyceryl transferase [Eubacterium sp.]|nr:prolipoprotein diacylglyceryl transferase [Eubacterium sp.]
MGADVAFPHLGIYIPEVSKGIEIGGFSIAFYGMIIAFGMIMGIVMARWSARRTGQNPELYMDYAIWGILFALVGARVYYVAFSWDSYKDDLIQVFNIRGGGMAIYGGVIAAVLTAAIFCKRRKYNFLLFTDTATTGLILGQIIGRWGNFMNKEAFGEYTDSLFAMRLKVSQVNPASITETMRANIQRIDAVDYIQVHPTFLYESVWNLVVLIIMIATTKKKKFHGQIFLTYIIGYGLGRVWIEGLRTDQLQIGASGIAVSQVLSAVLVLVGIVLCFVFKKKFPVGVEKKVQESENKEENPESDN